MAKMLKANKVIIVADESVKEYLEQGYDHISEDGEIISPATGGRMITLSEHNIKLAEVTADLKEEIKVLEVENDRLDKLVKQLKGQNGK